MQASRESLLLSLLAAGASAAPAVGPARLEPPAVGPARQRVVVKEGAASGVAER